MARNTAWTTEIGSQRLPRPDGNTVAYARTEGRGPTVVFLGGFRSDMTGTKAMALEAWARRTGRAYLRFDYLGHGQSSGRFEDGTIGRWLDNSLAVIDAMTTGKLVLVGSSMGGWLSLLVALQRPERLAGLVLIAAAPDFTERMLLKEPVARGSRDPAARGPAGAAVAIFARALGLHLEADRGGAQSPGARQDARAALPGAAAARPERSRRAVGIFAADRRSTSRRPRSITTFVKGGDHRLSTPADIARLIATVEELAR